MKKNSHIQKIQHLIKIISLNTKRVNPKKKKNQTQHRDIIKKPNPRNANRSNTPINEIPKTKKQFK